MKGLLILALGATLLVAACGGSEPAVKATGTAGVVQTQCSRCHPLKRVCAKMDAKDAAQWTITVQRMIKNGAKVTADQVPEIVQFLASADAANTPICQ